MKYISESAKKLKGQPMFHILAKARELELTGRRILHFEIGDPDFNTPRNIVQAAQYSLLRGETHYTNSKGLTEFREAAAEATQRSRKFKPSIEQVLATPGANAGIFYAIGCTTNPGDEVIIPNPCFPTYVSAISFYGAVPVRVQLKEKNEFRLDPQEVEKKITDKTRLIMINSPHNPTGSVMTEKEIERVYRLAEKYDLYLLSDEVYARMVYSKKGTGFSTPSIFDKCKERTILANSFSKSYAMTGWRLGVTIAPEDLIDRMALLLETSVSCVSPFIQKSGIEAIRGDQREALEMIEEYRKRRDVMVEGLNTLPGVRCLKSRGAFYTFPDVSGTGMSGDEFGEYILEKAGVACSPGSMFGENCEQYVRFCYTAPIASIQEGIERINRVLKNR